MFFQYKMRYLVVSKKKKIIHFRMGQKNQSLGITIYHHSTSLVMPIGEKHLNTVNLDSREFFVVMDSIKRHIC